MTRHDWALLALIGFLALWGFAGTVATAILHDQRTRTCQVVWAVTDSTTHPLLRDTLPWCPKETR